MRVIAGKHKGRKLKSVKGKQTRPTSDKIKESVFQIIGPFFNGGICLDLFAGSGALGFEALSRGMDKVIFIEKDANAIRIIHDNIKQIGLSNQIEVYRTDALRSLNVLKKRNIKFDLVFIDPPYGQLNDQEIMTQLIELELLNSRAILYYEYGLPLEVDVNLMPLPIYRQINYGTTTGVTIFQNN